MSAPFLSIIIPAYNEEAVIEQVAKDAIDTLQKTGLNSFELVLVNDGSTDQTGFRMDQMRQQLECVQVASHQRNRGLGAALRTGFGTAKGRIVTWIPGDGQFDLGEILDGLSLLEESDIVLVLRRGRKEASRNVISLCFHTLIRLLFHFDATDASGIYLLPRELLVTLDPKADNVFYNLEVPLLCIKHRKRMRQITVGIRPRRSGASKVTNFQTIARNLGEVLKYRMRA
ncbi:MAG: hypothetical protein DMG31_15050 [Acidobacteria bacterium]|nr:MAG: hypothetical protein DMG31_15050 [Acidobacteriota bacterium]